MSSPSPYGPPAIRRVETGSAVRATVGWSFGSGLMLGAVIGLVALATGALLNEFGGYDDNDISPWFAVAVFAGTTIAATALASLITVPVLLLMRRNEGFAAMSALVQGLLSWLIGWVPFGLLLLFLFVGLPQLTGSG